MMEIRRPKKTKTDMLLEFELLQKRAKSKGTREISELCKVR